MLKERMFPYSFQPEMESNHTQACYISSQEPVYLGRKASSRRGYENRA